MIDKNGKDISHTHTNSQGKEVYCHESHTLMPNNETWEVELDKKWLHYFGKNAGGEVRHPFYESNRNFIREQLTLARRETIKEIVELMESWDDSDYHSAQLIKMKFLSPTSLTRNDEEHA